MITRPDLMNNLMKGQDPIMDPAALQECGLKGGAILSATGDSRVAHTFAKIRSNTLITVMGRNCRISVAPITLVIKVITP